MTMTQSVAETRSAAHPGGRRHARQPVPDERAVRGSLPGRPGALRQGSAESRDVGQPAGHGAAGHHDARHGRLRSAAAHPPAPAHRQHSRHLSHRAGNAAGRTPGHGPGRSGLSHQAGRSRTRVQRVEAHLRATVHARRLDALSEKLARQLSPADWECLFHGPDFDSIHFEEKVQTVLYAEAIGSVNWSQSKHDSFTAEVEWLAVRHRGTVDRFIQGAAAISFDEPASCVRMAMDLQRSAADAAAAHGHSHRHMRYRRLLQRPPDLPNPHRARDMAGGAGGRNSCHRKHRGFAGNLCAGEGRHPHRSGELAC